MSSLATCDEYSLHLILSFLRGGEILRLVLCGARNLSLKVFACRSLSFTWCGPGRSRWPSLISSFSRLEHLKYENAEELKALPCEGLEIALLPRSLKSFSAKFFDPISPLLSATVTPDSRLSYSSIALTAQLPLLETLIIRTTLEIPPEALNCFASIPLTRLELISQSLLWNPTYWPKTLKSLSLPQILPCEDVEKWIFPPQLESLSLFTSQAPIWMERLPPTLTELNTRDYALTNSNHTKYLSLLPRGLKTLVMSFYGMRWDPDYFKCLPPALETLRVFLRLDEPLVYRGSSASQMDETWKPFSDIVDSILKACPPSVTTLDISNCKYCVDQLPRVPRGLKSLILRDPHRLTENTFFPSSTCLFPHLTSLDLSYGLLQPPKLLTLPTSITQLTLVELTDEISFALPPLLQLVVKTGYLSEYGASRLPRTITRLEIPDSLLHTKESYAQLPPNLSTLSVTEMSGIYQTRNPNELPCIGNPSTLPLLPKTITTIEVYGPSWMNGDWLESLSACLPRLENLTLYRRSGFLEELLHHITTKSLRYLSMAINDLSVIGLKSLSRCTALKEIYLESFANDIKPTQLQDEDLIHIPRSAYAFHLGAAPLLTDNVERYLPRDMNDFYCRGYTHRYRNNTFDPLQAYREQ